MASTRFYGEQNVPGAPGQAQQPQQVFVPNMNTTGAPVGYTQQLTGSLGYGDPMQQVGNAATFYGGPQLGNEIAGVSFDIGEGHGAANKGAKMFNKTRNNPKQEKLMKIRISPKNSSLRMSKSSIPNKISAPLIAINIDNDLYLFISSLPKSQAKTSVITGIIQLISDA